MKILRAITNTGGQHYGLWLTDQEVVSMVEAMPPHVMLAVLRISLLVRLLVFQPPQVLLLLAAAAAHKRS